MDDVQLGGGQRPPNRRPDPDRPTGSSTAVADAAGQAALREDRRQGGLRATGERHPEIACVCLPYCFSSGGMHAHAEVKDQGAERFDAGETRTGA